MRKYLSFVAAASLAAGMVAYADDNAATDAMHRTGDKMNQMADRMSGSTTQPSAVAPDADKIRDVLAQSIDASVTKKGLDNVIDRFTKADQKRIGKITIDTTTLDGRIAQFQKDWKDKYNEDFKIERSDTESVALNDLQIQQGMLGGSARLAGERVGGNEANAPDNNTPNRVADPTGRNDQQLGDNNAANVHDRNVPGVVAGRSGPVDTTVNGAGGSDQGTTAAQARARGETNVPSAADANANPDTARVNNGMARSDTNPNGTVNNNVNNSTDASANRNRDNTNRNMATVTFTDANGKPCTLNLINEGTLMNSWKIDVPDSLDQQRLYDNLLKHLTMVDENKANWPADKNEAYRSVANHLLTGISDSENMPASMNRGGM